jgi:hypothetical protein
VDRREDALELDVELARSADESRGPATACAPQLADQLSRGLIGCAIDLSLQLAFESSANSIRD